MLKVRETACRECSLINELIKKIDCQVAKMAHNLYVNLVYMVNKPIEACKISTLLHYKRILTYKACNAEYAVDFSVEKIGSRVNFLSVGCDCCNEPVSIINRCTTSTTSTTTSTTTAAPTTTTTTTI